jgi:hypothetical protein
MTERVLRITGALALLGTGAVHLQQYAGNYYSSIPTIGTLFILNFVAATVIAIGLLLPLRSALVKRLLALGGVGMAVSSLVALIVAENGSLFGFSESGYRTAIVLAIVLEAITALCLGADLAYGVRRPSRRLRASTRPAAASSRLRKYGDRRASASSRL